MNLIGLFDTAVGSRNLGDQIIMDAVRKELLEIFPDDFFVNMPTHDYISEESYKLLEATQHQFVCGTNLLSSNMETYNQWKIKLDDTKISNAILMGVGWWQYQQDPDIYTQNLLKKVLSGNVLHSVRDQYTVKKLNSAGFYNVINTGCPTLWKFTPEHCKNIPVSKGQYAVMTITDYNQDRDNDKKMIETVIKNYEKVFIWIQGSRDKDYIDSITEDVSIEIISPTLEAYDAVLSSDHHIDYIGTRLHAGIRAMQHNRRAIIVSVDNRATEMGKNFNLNVIERTNLNSLENIINDEIITDVLLPHNEINLWKKQFSEKKKLNVALLNTLDNGGGAARAAYRLHQSLLMSGVHSNYFVKGKKSNNNHTFILNTLSKEDEKINQLINTYYVSKNKTERGYTYFSETYGTENFDPDYFQDIDVINLHWIEMFISLKHLEQLVNLNKPIIWTLHDERPFTGGCHYRSGCTEYTDNCSPCIQLKEDPYNLPQRVLEQKIAILKNADLTIVTPSHWLAKEAKKSTLFKDLRVEVIPNSIETDIFQPYDKTEMKKKLGIAEDVTTLMFGAQTNQDRRKGFTELMEALNLCFKNHQFLKACEENKILIILIGKGTQEFENFPMDTLSLGSISNDHKLAQIYSATDLFILPSLEDNLPNMMLEAMSCATPVIGFETGGIPDVVKNEINGLTIKTGDYTALSNAIIRMVFDQDTRSKFSKNSRKTIENDYKFSDQSSKYISLFKELSIQKKKKDFIESSVYDETLYEDIITFSKARSIEEPKAQYQIQRQADIERFKKTFEILCKTKFSKNPKKKIDQYKILMRTMHELIPNKIQSIPGADEFIACYQDLCSVNARINPTQKLVKYKKLISVWHKYKKEIK